MYSKIKNNFRRNLALYYFLLSGLLLRLILAKFPGFKIDTDSWFAWSIRLKDVGFSSFYEPGYFADYPPGMLYLLSLLAEFKFLFNISDPTYYLLLKVPSIIAEIIISYLAYKIVLRKGSTLWAYAAAYGILFNLGLIFNSSIWGQGDAILTLLLLLSVLFLNEKRYVLSSIFIGISFLTKPQTIALFPIFFLFLIRDRLKMGLFLKLSIPALFVVFLLQLPFFITNPILGLPQLLINTANQYPDTSLFAYNFWGIVGFWVSDSNTFLNIPYNIFGFLLFLIYWIVLGIIYLKAKHPNIFVFCALAGLGFFFLPTRVHERYLYPAIPFLFISASLLKSKFLYSLTILMSSLYLINLYYVYTYYNEIYSNLTKFLYIPGFYEMLDSHPKTLSVISTLLFGVIIITICKLISYENHKAS